jgi:hypothetical protein
MTLGNMRHLGCSGWSRFARTTRGLRGFSRSVHLARGFSEVPRRSQNVRDHGGASSLSASAGVGSSQKDDLRSLRVPRIPMKPYKVVSQHTYHHAA